MASVNLAPLRKRAGQFLPSKAGQSSLRKCGRIYRNFIYKRFLKMSAGGWRRLKNPPTSPVLQKTKTLLNVWRPSQPGRGSKTVIRARSITVGYGGGASHPSTNLSVEDLADIHNFGLGRMPVRKIVIQPTGPVNKLCKNQIQKDWRKALSG